MIYDCFTFWNEFDLLEIRLNELKDVVDEFVICEGDVTFAGKTKPLLLKDRIHEFSNFNITLLTYQGKTNPENSWENEIAQRNCLAKGLKNALPNDTIVLTDIDEIPTVNSVAVLPYYDGPICLEMTFSYYFVNNMRKTEKWYHPKAFKMKELVADFHEMRHGSFHNMIQMAGHHMSYLGGLDTIKNKVANFSHQEFNTPDFFEKMNGLFEANKSIFDSSLDLSPKDPRKIKTMPKYLIENMNKFQKHFLPWKVNI